MPEIEHKYYDPDEPNPLDPGPIGELTEEEQEQKAALTTGSYVRPFMYPKQETAIFNDKRIAVIEASTKSGKSVGCMAWLVEQAILYGAPGRNYWWIAPSRTQAQDIFERIKNGLPREMYHKNDTERTVRLLHNDSKVWFKTGEEPDLLYGADVYAAVIDEASRMREASWVAMQTTLTATKGPIRIIGNVKGRKNWFWRLARRAEKGDDPRLHYAKITAGDAVRAGVLDSGIVMDAQRYMPEEAFLEINSAEAADD
jgi:hypothetical protein